jgi:hypothetical protein
MPDGGRKLRFALEHNFPAPALSAFGLMMPNVELVAIAEIDGAFAELDDWEHESAFDRTIGLARDCVRARHGVASAYDHVALVALEYTSSVEPKIRS